MKNYIKVWITILLISGTLGTIFFFPVKINSRYTCLFHRIFDAEHSYQQHHAVRMNSKQNKEIDKSHGIADSSHIAEINLNRGYNSHHDPSELLRQYIQFYAFFWWGSIGIIVISFYIYRYSRLKNRRGIDFP